MERTLSSSIFYKLSPFLFSILILSVAVLPFSTTTVYAREDDGVGVGLEAVRPRITEVKLKHNLATDYLHIHIFDLNSWRHVSQVSVEFYRNNDLIRLYVFNQTEDLERSIEVREGEGLVHFESRSSEEQESVDQRCTLSLYFEFSAINYDRLIIRARDRDNGTSRSSMDFHGITTGRRVTYYLLPFLLFATGAMIYRTVKTTGGEIDE